MKRLTKKTELKKLSIDTTTIRLLSDQETTQVHGGATPRGTTTISTVCSREPLTCP